MLSDDYAYICHKCGALAMGSDMITAPHPDVPNSPDCFWHPDCYTLAVWDKVIYVFHREDVCAAPSR